MEQATSHLSLGRKQFVNPHGLPGQVGIVGAQDNTGVARVLAVQAQRTKLLYDRQRDVLVRIEPGDGSLLPFVFFR